MRIDLTRYAPPGVDIYREKKWFVAGMLTGVFCSMDFFIRYFNRRANLYIRAGTKMVLDTNAVMPDFAEVLGGSLLFFLIPAVFMAATALYHYAYHYQGSRSIYLMRRLPDRLELHRRCLTLPLLAILLCLLTCFSLLLVYFWIYMTFTPKDCLTPGQWWKIWSVLL